MAYKINGTTVVDNSRNVCACCVTSCCVTASTKLDAPSGNTASRPGSPATGSIYFDTDESSLVAYDGSAWASVGGAGGAVNVNEFTAGSIKGFADNSSVCRHECCLVSFYEVGFNDSTALFFYSRGMPCSTTSPATTNGIGGVSIKNGTTGEISNLSGGAGSTSDSYCCGPALFQDQTIRPCGLEDKDPRATVPLLTIYNCQTFVATLDGTGVLRVRCTGYPTTSPVQPGQTFNYPANAIFRQYGVYQNECKCGISSYGDSCCGVTISVNSTRLSCCLCSACTFLDASFGFKPCYFYALDGGSFDGATSPIRVQRICSARLCCGSLTNGVAIDYPNKKFYTVNSGGAFTGHCCRFIQSWCICDKGFPDCQSCWCVHPTPFCTLFTCFMHCMPCHCTPYGRGKLHNGRIIFPLNEQHCNNMQGMMHSFPLTAGSVCSIQLSRCSSYDGRNNGMVMGLHHDKDGNLRGFFHWLAAGKVNCDACQNCSLQGMTEFVWAPNCDISSNKATNMYEYVPGCRCNNFAQTLCCTCAKFSTSYLYSMDWSGKGGGLSAYNPLTGTRSLTGLRLQVGFHYSQAMSFVFSEPAVDWQSGECTLMPDSVACRTINLKICSRYNCIALRQCIDTCYPTNGYSFSFHRCCLGCIKSCSNTAGCSGCGGLPLCNAWCDLRDTSSRKCFTMNQYLCQDSVTNIRPVTWAMCPKV